MGRVEDDVLIRPEHILGSRLRLRLVHLKLGRDRLSCLGHAAPVKLSPDYLVKLTYFHHKSFFALAAATSSRFLVRQVADLV
jgi:hypothetical protein